MKIDSHILVTISIVSLFFVILAEGTDFSPPAADDDDDDEIYGQVKKAIGPAFDGAKDKFGPISSLDLDDFEEAKNAFGPIPSFDEAKENLGPASSALLDKAKDAMGPISPSSLEDAKEALAPAAEALSPISPAALDKAKEALGPSSSGIIDKAKDKINSLKSWITQSKEETSLDAQDDNDSESADDAEAPSSIASPLDPYGVLDGAKQKFDSLMDSISEEKEQISPSVVEEAENESSPAPSKSPSDKSKNKKGPSPSPTPNLSKILDEARDSTPITTQNKEETSADSPSISVKAQNGKGANDGLISAPAPAPVLPSTLKEAQDAIGSYSSKAMDAAKGKFSSLQSFLSENKLQESPESDIKLHAGPVYFDHDAALAVESTIKQAQANSQLAMDQAKTILSDPTLDKASTGKCVEQCMTNYETCVLKLNKAMEDLKARNVEMLTDDISAVESEIRVCQKCFLENTKMQSPFNDLEAATIKATRECLNVLDHSG